MSLFDAISRGQTSVAEWLDFASELGLDGVECGPLLVRPLGPVTPAEFRRLADDRGLEVSNFTGYSDFTHPDPDVREREIAAAVDSLRVARELGAPSVRVLAGQQRPEIRTTQGISWVAEAVRRVAEQAARLGLRVNIENHTKAFTWTAFDFAIHGEVFLAVMDALRDVPVGVQFDVANPLVAGEDPLTLFEQVRTRIGYIHLNDVRRPGAFEFVPVGTGIAPIGEVLARLRADGYPGWVGIEEASRTGQEGFRQAVQHVRRVLAA